MALRDWIAQYPRVQALLQHPDEALDYAPDGEQAEGMLSPIRASVFGSHEVITVDDPFRYYILESHEVITVDDPCVWRRWVEGADRIVNETEIGDACVCTCFVSLPAKRGASDPALVFQTVVFGGRLDWAYTRYATWDEAVLGHALMVAWVQETEGGGEAA